MLTFYFAPGSSSMAAHIALHEVALPFEPRPLSFAKRETRTSSYLALNPEGKVPTLVIDGRPLTEVAGILFYLAKRCPAARLLPDGDPEAEARAISWMSFIAAPVHPARRQGPQRCHEVFAIAEQRLGPADWLLGQYSVADIHLFRLYWRFVNSLHPDPGTFPKLTAHYQRMMARPAVQRTCAIEAAIGYEMPA